MHVFVDVLVMFPFHFNLLYNLSFARFIEIAISRNNDNFDDATKVHKLKLENFNGKPNGEEEKELENMRVNDRFKNGSTMSTNQEFALQIINPQHIFYLLLIKSIFLPTPSLSNSFAQNMQMLELTKLHNHSDFLAALRSLSEKAL